jgi:Transposase
MGCCPLQLGGRARASLQRDRESGPQRKTGIWELRHHFHDLGFGIELVATARKFKVEAVRLVRERGVAVAQASRDLDVHENVPRTWIKR